MDMLDTAQAQLVALEGALVQEFRVLQKLVVLTRGERYALTQGDLSGLDSLVAKKLAVQDELGRLEETRRAAIAAWAQVTQPGSALPTLATMLPHLDSDTAGRLAHLREGILALSNELSELTRGNRGLAAAALERVDAVRDFLVSLNSPDEGYQPWGAPTARAGSVLAVEQWA